MWTEITRPKYERDELRYASDLTDAEWGLIEPYMPPAKAVGRPRTTDLREVVNAILYVLRAGCPWRMMPKDFRHARRYSATSMPGGTTRHGSGSITIC